MKPQAINNKALKILGKESRLKLLNALLVLGVIVILTGAVFYDKTIYITENGETRQVISMNTDPYTILEENGVELGEYDKFSFSGFENKTAYIEIERAYDVVLEVDKKTLFLETATTTVGELLAREGISLGAFDEVTPAIDTTLYNDADVVVTRVEYKDTISRENIAYETEYVQNLNTVIGDNSVLTEGENGIRRITRREKYVNGELVDTSVIDTKIEKEPVSKVIEQGAALAEPYAKVVPETPFTLENGLPTEYTRIISGKATAYTAGANALTASGRKAEIGTVAVNPNIIPYGSELYIVSQDGKTVYGYAVAADTGIGLMEGQIAVDVYMGDRENHYIDSCRWGAVQVDIYVLQEGTDPSRMS